MIVGFGERENRNPGGFYFWEPNQDSHGDWPIG